MVETRYSFLLRAIELTFVALSHACVLVGHLRIGFLAVRKEVVIVAGTLRINISRTTLLIWVFYGNGMLSLLLLLISCTCVDLAFVETEGLGVSGHRCLGEASGRLVGSTRYYVHHETSACSVISVMI